jgi:hypothetical protein
VGGVKMAACKKINWDEQPLGKKPDTEIAKEIGVHGSLVSRTRKLLGIPPFCGPRKRSRYNITPCEWAGSRETSDITGASCSQLCTWVRSKSCNLFNKYVESKIENGKYLFKRCDVIKFSKEYKRKTSHRFIKRNRVIQICDIGYENLDMCFNNLESSVRLSNILTRQGINTIRKLVSYTEEDFLEFEGAGRKTLRELKILLDELHLCLGIDPINVGLNPTR